MDFLIEDFGEEIFVLRPMTDTARAWAAAQLGDLPKFAGGLVIAPRYVGYVRRALPNAGFVLSEAAFGRQQQRMH